MARVVVIGAGISGLAFAHRLAELRHQQHLPLDVTVLDARARLGGVIDTHRRDSFLLEGGPDAFIAEQPWGLNLCRRVGLGDDIIQTRQEARRSFIVRRGRLVPVPEGFYLVAPGRLTTVLRMPLVSWTGRLRMACEPLIPPRTDPGDESVGRFVRRRLGREALDRLAQPMVGGIYAADPDRLSLEATLPMLRDMERRYGSLIRGIRDRGHHANDATATASGPRYSLFVSLRGGLATLVEALMHRMPEVRLRCNAAVTRIERRGHWRVHTAGEPPLEADVLCLAMTPSQAASLLREVTPDVATTLASIPCESVATINVAFRRDEVAHPLNGFGFVVPRIEGRRLVGCTFSSVKFAGRAPHGWVLLRAFVGGVFHRELLEGDDRSLERIVIEELQETLGARATPRLVTIHRYQAAMPQYHVGHLGRVETIERQRARYPGLYLLGNGFRGVGIPHCIRQGEAAAEQVAVNLGQPARPADVANPAVESV